MICFSSEKYTLNLYKSLKFLDSEKDYKKRRLGTI